MNADEKLKKRFQNQSDERAAELAERKRTDALEETALSALGTLFDHCPQLDPNQATTCKQRSGSTDWLTVLPAGWDRKLGLYDVRQVWPWFADSKKRWTAKGKALDAPLVCLHWADGCLDTWPEEINTNKDKHDAIQTGQSAVVVEVTGGIKTSDTYTALSFWTHAWPRTANLLCCIELRLSCFRHLHPTMKGHKYNPESGEWMGSYTFPGLNQIGADEFHKFWSTPENYRGRWYWRNTSTFDRWLSTHKAGR
jgi:hypothetical protein